MDAERVSDERLREMIGLSVRCVPASPIEVVMLVRELRELRARCASVERNGLAEAVRIAIVNLVHTEEAVRFGDLSPRQNADNIADAIQSIRAALSAAAMLEERSKP